MSDIKRGDKVRLLDMGSVGIVKRVVTSRIEVEFPGYIAWYDTDVLTKVEDNED